MPFLSMIPFKIDSIIRLNVMILYELILQRRKQIIKKCSEGKEQGVAIYRNSYNFNALQDGLEPTTP